MPAECLRHLSPLGWEHINLTGDYIWGLRQTTTFQRRRSRGPRFRFRWSRHARGHGRLFQAAQNYPGTAVEPGFSSDPKLCAGTASAICAPRRVCFSASALTGAPRPSRPLAIRPNPARRFESFVADGAGRRDRRVARHAERGRFERDHHVEQRLARCHSLNACPRRARVGFV